MNLQAAADGVHQCRAAEIEIGVTEVRRGVCVGMGGPLTILAELTVSIGILASTYVKCGIDPQNWPRKIESCWVPPAQRWIAWGWECDGVCGACRCLTEMGTEKESFIEMTERIGRSTGGVSVSPMVSSKKGSPDPVRPWGTSTPPRDLPSPRVV